LRDLENEERREGGRGEERRGERESQGREELVVIYTLIQGI
jgi:hypothetical protein